MVSAGELRQQGLGLPAGEDDGHLNRPLGPHNALDEGEFYLEHVAVEEEQGAQRLVLRGGRDVPLDCQMGEELPDLLDAHLLRVALAVEEDEAFDPVRVSLLRADAEVAQACDRADAIEQFLFRHGGRGRVENQIETSGGLVHYTRGAGGEGGKDSAFGAPLRSYAEGFGFCGPVTELYRIIQLNTR